MKITKNISVFQFQGLIKAGLSLSHIYFLELIDDEKIVKDIEGYEPYVNELYNLGCLDSNLEITIQGKNLLKEVYSREDIKRLKNKKKEYDERFLEWLSHYPKTDNQEGWPGFRTMHVNKRSCEEKYLEALKTYTHEEMIKALDWEVAARKDMTPIRNENQLTYMNSTEPYLNQKKYEVYIGLARKGPYKPKNQGISKLNKDSSTVTI